MPFVYSVPPVARMALSFDLERNLDDGTVFTQERYEKFLGMLKESENQVKRLLRSVALLNTIICVILFSKGIVLPYIDFNISEIPVAVEIATLLSCISFSFLIIGFVNEQAYSALVDQYIFRAMRPSEIDPDYVISSERHIQLFLKVFRPTLNIWGKDFLQAKLPFKIMSVRILILASISLLSIFVLHLIVIINSVYHTYEIY